MEKYMTQDENIENNDATQDENIQDDTIQDVDQPAIEEARQESQSDEQSDSDTAEKSLTEEISDVLGDELADELDDETAEPEEEPISDFIETEDGEELTVESVVEAVLFASDEPLNATRIVKILEAGSSKQVNQCVKNLNNKYKESGSAFEIVKIAGGFQMMTLDIYNLWLKKLVRVRTDNKLSQAALETLAIIAYKQPIIRADLEAIRGVSSGEMIRSLMYKGLVKIAGRAEVLGRPMLYGTTKKFLDVFGLNALKDLPKIEELKKPAKLDIPTPEEEPQPADENEPQEETLFDEPAKEEDQIPSDEQSQDN